MTIINEPALAGTALTADRGRGLLAGLWESSPWAVALVGLAVAVALGWGLLVLIGQIVRSARRTPGAAKLQVANAAVQAAVTWAVVTGTQAFGEHVFHLPQIESWVLALFLEAAVWLCIGRIVQHGRGHDEHGEPNRGFGFYGNLFWLFSALGGVLAVIGSDSVGMGIGRAAVVVFGTALWYGYLRTQTRPTEAPSRLRWTPRRLLVAIGALEPADQDVTDQHLEWQIRRLARAMRMANSRGLVGWMGRRALIARAEQTSPEVLDAARRRYASAYLVASTVHPDSPVMRGVLDVVQAEQTGAAAELQRQRDEIAAGRAELSHQQQLLLAAVASQRAQLQQERANLDLYRADLEHQHTALQQAARRTPVARNEVPSNVEHLDDRRVDYAELLEKVEAFIREARKSGKHYGQRTIKDKFGVSRAKAADLICDVEHLLGLDRDTAAEVQHADERTG